MIYLSIIYIICKTGVLPFELTRLESREGWVPISINPDAHKKEGFHDMYFGVCAARKGGLTKDFTFNTLSRAQIETYFENRKRK